MVQKEQKGTESEGEKQPRRRKDVAQRVLVGTANALEVTAGALYSLGVDGHIPAAATFLAKGLRLVSAYLNKG